MTKMIKTDSINSWWGRGVTETLVYCWKTILQFPIMLSYYKMQKNHMSIQKLKHECFHQSYAQQPKPGNNTNVYQEVNKLGYIHTTDYYSAIKKNKLLINVTWMNHKMLCWAKQARPEREHNVWFHLREILGKTKQIYSEGKQIHGCIGLLGVTKRGTRNLWGNRNVVYLDHSRGYTFVYICQTR